MTGAGSPHHAQGPEIRAEIPKQAAPADSSGHHRPLHPGIFEDVDDFAQLPHVNPVELLDQLRQGGVGFAAVSRGDDGGAAGPGGLGEEERELALTRD